ncbi:MAG: IS110 family transposase [Phycisphaerae bacterium]
MHYVGIDLHKKTLVVAVEDDHGPVGRTRRFQCEDESAIVKAFRGLRPFRAVIEASSSYRWLYALLEPLGEVILAHPLRLRAIVAARAKTDKLDAALLAQLLRADLVPEAYVPPQPYQVLREVTRTWARLGRRATRAKNQMHAVLQSRNLHSPYRDAFCKSGRRWMARQDLGIGGNLRRDELLRRLDHFERERLVVDDHLAMLADEFPQIEALLDLYGIGPYSALLIVAELGEVDRFGDARQVGAYAGLTPRVHQSGERAWHGQITKQGSRWLRWILVQAAIKIVRKDRALGNLYRRVRRRSGKKRARVAVARKLAGICWVRLRAWHRAHAGEAAAEAVAAH